MAHHKAQKNPFARLQREDWKNRYVGKTTRNAIRDIKAIENKQEAEKKLPEVISMIDKLAKKNVIHRNKAANLKSKLMKRIHNQK